MSFIAVKQVVAPLDTDRPLLPKQSIPLHYIMYLN